MGVSRVQQGLLSCVHHGEMTNMLVDGLLEKEESIHGL